MNNQFTEHIKDVEKELMKKTKKQLIDEIIINRIALNLMLMTKPLLQLGDTIKEITERRKNDKV